MLEELKWQDIGSPGVSNHPYVWREEERKEVVLPNPEAETTDPLLEKSNLEVSWQESLGNGGHIYGIKW